MAALAGRADIGSGATLPPGSTAKTFSWGEFAASIEFLDAQGKVTRRIPE